MMPCPSSGTSFSPESYLFPPVARSLMWRAVIPSSLHLWATSWAADKAAYGEDASRSAFAFIPPVTWQMVSLPERPVTCMKVSLKAAKTWHTPNTFSPSATWGLRLMTCSFFFSFPLRGAISVHLFQTPPPERQAELFIAEKPWQLPFALPIAKQKGLVTLKKW